MSGQYTESMALPRIELTPWCTVWNALRIGWRNERGTTILWPISTTPSTTHRLVAYRLYGRNSRVLSSLQSSGNHSSKRLIRLIKVGSEAVASRTISQVTTFVTAFKAQVAATTVEVSSAVLVSSVCWNKMDRASWQIDVSASVASPGNCSRLDSPGWRDAASGPRFFFPGTWTTKCLFF